MGAGSLTLAGWRREVAGLYARVRADADPRRGHEAWRQGRDRLMRGHPDSPLGPDDVRRRRGVPVAPYDPAMRFTAELEPAPEARLELRTGTDGVVALRRLGTVSLPLGGLDVWWLEGYGGGLWLPVRDATCGRTSYGGGRYLLDTVKGADLGGDDRHLVVDLNFLYHPSCAYDAAWACPLAPPGNRLETAVEAGEQLP